MAFAGARFTDSLLQASQGKKGIVEPTFVESPVFADQGVEFFATNVELGPNGVEKIHPIGETSDYEKELITMAIADLKKNIEKGKSFVKA
jgi:malate dehydrogenase